MAEIILLGWVRATDLLLIVRAVSINSVIFLYSSGEGGGVALLRTQEAISAVAQDLQGDQKIGAERLLHFSYHP